MTSALWNYAITRPKTVFWLTAILVLIAASQFPRVKVDTDPENMLPTDQSDRVFHNQVEESFSLHDAIVVGIVNAEHSNGIYNAESLGALHKLSKQILQIEGVIRPDLMSLAESDNITQADNGALLICTLTR